MVKYTAKLEEECGIPYIPAKGYNPKDFYNNFHKPVYYHYLYNNAMFYAAEGGNMDIVKLMIEKGANNFDLGMYGATKGGHMEIVKFMIDKGADNFNLSMYAAAAEGNMDIVKLMIEKGATHFDRGMYGAAEGGHIDIVNYLKQYIK